MQRIKADITKAAIAGGLAAIGTIPNAGACQTITCDARLGETCDAP
eukprot:COSAG02_NODE_47460_length_341_cov_0.561983_2_plen_45_part_01